STARPPKADDTGNNVRSEGPAAKRQVFSCVGLAPQTKKPPSLGGFPASLLSLATSKQFPLMLPNTPTRCCDTHSRFCQSSPRVLRPVNPLANLLPDCQPATTEQSATSKQLPGYQSSATDSFSLRI